MEQSTARYMFDQRRRDDHERLTSMERCWDPGTIAIVESLGIEPGWRCLEIGAGAGSIARWLADRVGPDGEVLATDISTVHLDGVAAPNLEVRAHDVLTDPLPRDRFDLVHARLVVEHVGRHALGRAAAAVRSGGWLLLEDHEWGAALCHPDGERYRQVFAALARYMASHAGYDAGYGRRLVHELEAAGLQDVDAEGRIRVYRGGTTTGSFLRLSIEAMSAGLLASGEMTADDLEWMLRVLDDRDTVFLTPCIAGWGRKR